MPLYSAGVASFVRERDLELLLPILLLLVFLNGSGGDDSLVKGSFLLSVVSLTIEELWCRSPCLIPLFSYSDNDSKSGSQTRKENLFLASHDRVASTEALAFY